MPKKKAARNVGGRGKQRKAPWPTGNQSPFPSTPKKK